MTPDAERRMLVYQEGQRSWNSGAECPYIDWRAATWMKGRTAARAYNEKFFAESKTVPCGICGTPTRMTGTKRCDRCWELETRIRADSELAQQILDSLKAGS